MKKLTIAVTGASGLIGQRLCRLLATWPNQAIDVIAISRSRPDVDGIAEWRALPDLENPEANYTELFSGTDVVIHCAGRAHILQENTDVNQSKAAFDQVNCKATYTIARAALDHGVQRFIFVSSSAVVAEKAENSLALENLDYACLTPYGESKMLAEQALLELFTQRPDKELSIIRPPLVIARGAPGNFALFEKLANVMPVNPLAGITNDRSVITCSNLITLLGLIATDSRTPPAIVHPVEREQISTSELLACCRIAQGKRMFSLPLSALLIKSVFVVTGRSAMYQKMMGNFRMDDTETRSHYGNYWVNTLLEELK